MRKANVLSILLEVVLLAVAVIVEAQQPKKVPRIGYLSSFDPVIDSRCSEGVRLAPRELGYIEGQNIAIDIRRGSSIGPELAAELARLKVVSSWYQEGPYRSVISRSV
jgi:putative tryptophan/tyrosine transport system substrate-binding protein